VLSGGFAVIAHGASRFTKDIDLRAPKTPIDRRMQLTDRFYTR